MTITQTNSRAAMPNGGEVYTLTTIVTDTTTTIDSSALNNTDGSLIGIGGTLALSAASGTSPTVQLQLIASQTATGNYFVVQTLQSGSLASVQGTATASTSTTTIGLDTAAFGLSALNYPYYKLRIVQGGTTPSISGILGALARRRTQNV